MVSLKLKKDNVVNSPKMDLKARVTAIELNDTFKISKFFIKLLYILTILFTFIKIETNNISEENKN